MKIIISSSNILLSETVSLNVCFARGVILFPMDKLIDFKINYIC